jgi:hypothetical protein
MRRCLVDVSTAHVLKPRNITIGGKLDSDWPIHATDFERDISLSIICVDSFY